MAPYDTMPVIIRGVHYPTVTAASLALGVKKITIYSALSRGRLDFVGLGRGHRPKENRISGRAKPCVIGGFAFTSLAAASVALGFKPKYLRDALRKGKAQTQQKIMQAAFRLRADAENAAMRQVMMGRK
jgi:hypothetical protein